MKFFLYYKAELIEQILVMYLNGMPINSIGVYFEMDPNEVNFIIDHYAPYLG